ncbi:hypothetical protein BGS_0287 [Beggiatoa sp. SS]|nr:hypothetical protein BGS_0287 [Beggiatoa sp. SS]
MTGWDRQGILWHRGIHIVIGRSGGGEEEKKKKSIRLKCKGLLCSSISDIHILSALTACERLSLGPLVVSLFPPDYLQIIFSIPPTVGKRAIRFWCCSSLHCRPLTHPTFYQR